jgi:hypothetical protein
MQGIEIPIGAPLGQLDKDLNGAQKKLKQFTQTADKDVGGLAKSANTAFNSIALSLTGALSVGAFISFGKEVLAVTAEFEKLGAVLGNTLGSNALADLKLKEIEEFAAKTPFGVKELTDSFVKLANQGFKPTGDEMRRLGDLAASTGKSFDQLAEAILDAQTGEFERLKEFGIRAQDAGDKVIFTFKGVQTQVDKSSEAIRTYITSLGDAEGVSGSMAVISETLTGKISNLGDAWDKMLVSIGSNTSGIFSGAIDIITKGINKITELNRNLNIFNQFKLKGDFFQKLYRTINPFSDRGMTSTEKAIYTIKRADDEVTKFVGDALAGAKSTSDFGKAISDLQKKGNDMIADFKNFSPEGLAGIKKFYEDGIKALRDGRTAFANEAAKPLPANFGTPKKTKAAKTEFNRDEQFKAKSSISELELFLENYKKTADSLNRTPLVPFPQIKERLALVNQDLINFNQQASDIIQNSLVNTFGGIGNALGTAIANGTSITEALGQTLLSSVASVLGELGKLLIATGVGMISLKTAFKNPYLTIAAGVALVALSGYAAAKASKITGGVGGGGGSSGGSGLVPTPQASSTISTSAAGSSQNFGGGTVVFEISGTNLIGVLNRAGAKLQRFGG